MRDNGPLVSAVVLREVRAEDLPVFFLHQLDSEANYMAAFTPKDPADRDSFMERWEKILADKDILKRTILYNGKVAGNIVSFLREGKREVGYWLGKGYWGQGVASEALKQFLGQEGRRPIYARVVVDNKASVKVLKKCGFEVVAREWGFAHARGKEVEEFLLELKG